jgi:pimeloyl-ACP methyl ester carboxylesterase
VSAAEKTILFLHGAGGPPPADAAFVTALAAMHNLLVPPHPGDAAAAMAELIARTSGGAAHVVAEGAAAALACRLALDHGGLVGSLTLSAPEPADAALLERLGKIEAPTLLLLGSAAPAELRQAMEAYQQRIPRATRILLYGGAPDLPLAAMPAWSRLVTDFVDRGERFVVNAGGES